jgi:hypothetical protein
MIALSALALGACAPGPARMPASEAGAWLERFAASTAPENVCTPQGRATLRGAVRAYGAAMAEAGQVWPNIGDVDREANAITAVEASVVIATASGLVELSDLRGPARAMALQMTFAHWPSVRDLHMAAQVACGDLVQLQQTASRLILERERYRVLAERAERRRDRRAQEQLSRQAARMERSMTEIQIITERVTAKVEESRGEI